MLPLMLLSCINIPNKITFTSKENQILLVIKIMPTFCILKYIGTMVIRSFEMHIDKKKTQLLSVLSSIGDKDRGKPDIELLRGGVQRASGHHPHLLIEEEIIQKNEQNVSTQGMMSEQVIAFLPLGRYELELYVLRNIS